ncbi:uncharacterized protein LAESUDRAFT_720836 [Laetiporus sulphureus 93-53]|uniref:DUF7330 domain-containing protein n=1 Tax=Laetiporus sulphureus 93-53 TaxID=1314785 RepID=A0A165HDG8_9APHY|nr:uncharacterized protein LAESUDRAFT_720836 [Laetiporus sulphureus 93-53]KZT11590.1 hypothetical protein LAESUDRAFT_720836 [Laetiporus sulphureus 93-53]
MPGFHSFNDFRCPAGTESLLDQPTGSHRVKYRGAGEHSKWDFALETDRRPIDLSLVLPHYRAHSQPLDHRLAMYVGSESSESVKIKVCRNFPPTRTTKFQLEVNVSSDADVTIWLPSDFRGHIHRSASCKKTTFSAGFTNRILQNACITQSRRPSVISMCDQDPQQYSDLYISDKDHSSAYSDKDIWPGKLSGGADEDEVVVHTYGHVTFRMWDVHRGEPEARCREACKRMFGMGWCTKRSPEVVIDWDFLLED